MPSILQIRRDTGANWSSVNPVLAQGEIGLNLDTFKFKIGDGVTHWNSLAYSSGALPGGGTTGQVLAKNSGSDYDVVWSSATREDFEYDNLASFPVTGEASKIYVAKDTNKIYRWNGSAYVELSGGGAWGSITGSLSSQTDLQSALDGKVNTNTAISGNTKTKITYDAKGLVTAGTDAGISDITGLQTALDGKTAANPTITGATKTKVTYDAKGLVTSGADANLDDLGDVVITSPTSNQVIKYDGSNWVNAAPPATISTLDDLTDVTIATPSNNQVLKYNGSQWVNSAPPATVATLDDLTDVTVTTPTNGQVLTYNGSQWVNTAAATGITSINALTTATQTFATGTSGTDFGISSATSTHTFNLPVASATNTGKLSSTDWSTFNSKEPALSKGNLTEATSAVLTISSGTGAVIGSGTSIEVKQSSGSQSGYLSSTDWTTFNGKQAQLNGTGFVKVSGTTVSYDNSTYLTAALTSLGTSGNGQTGATQTLATGTTGTDFGIVSSGNTHTFNIPDAGASARGLVTTGTQTLAGAKTFSSILTVSAGGASITGTTTITGSTTASGAIARGQNNTSTLVAAANNDVLVGIDVATTFTPSTYTGVTAYTIRTASTFAPTSGNSAFASKLVAPTINQTGGASGITRGTYINPTLTAAADWRSLEWSNNSGWGLYGAGTANNYLNGATYVGTTTTSAVKFVVAGSITASSAIARGVYANNTLVAAANSDTLVALDIAPTYTLGAYTGVTKWGLRVTDGGATVATTTASSTAFQATGTTGTLMSVTDTNTGDMLKVNGTNGTLLTVTDTVTGDIFNVNDSGGTTRFKVNSNGAMYQNSITVTGFSSATNTIISIDKTTGNSARYDYVLWNASTGAYRAGTLTAVWDGTNIAYTETTTPDLVASTAAITLSADISSGNTRLIAAVSSGTWNIKIGARIV